MATEDLGTLQIGLRADLSQLEADLKAAQTKLDNVRIKDKYISIRVNEVTDAELRRAMFKMNKSLESAAKVGVKITPQLSVTQLSVTALKKSIQDKLNAGKALTVPITADVNGEALRGQILQAIGVTSIPLTWHWDGEPPPGKLSGSVGIKPDDGGKGGAPTGGHKGTGGKGGGGGAAATPTPAPTPKPPKGGQPIAEAVLPGPGKPATGAAKSAPKTATVKQPATAQAAPAAPAAPATPAVAPKIGQAGAPKIGGAAPVIGAAQLITNPPPKTPEQLLHDEVAHVVAQLTRGRTEGMTGLLKLGSTISPGQGVNVKPRGRLAKFLKAQENPDQALEAINVALAAFQNAEEREPGRQAFSGGARGLAGALPQGQSPQSILRIREMIEHEARTRRGEFAQREDVKQFKALFKEQGFGGLVAADTLKIKGESSMIGSQLVAAEAMADKDPQAARKLLIDALAKISYIYPKLTRQLFPNDPGRVKGAISASKKPRGVKTVSPTIINDEGVEVPNPKYNLGAEVLTSATLGLFNKLYGGSLPKRDAAAKAQRKEDAALRKELKTQGDKPTPGMIAEATAKRQREEAAVEMTQRGLSRAREVTFDSPEQEARIKAQVQFNQKLGDAKLKGTKYTYLSDVAGRLFRARAGSAKGPISVEEIFDMLRAKGQMKAAGGPIPIKAGGLMGRLAKKGYEIPANAVLVGEKGEELIVPGDGGNAHVIDNQANNVPVWMRRNMAKDLTHRAEGGPLSLVRAGKGGLRYQAGGTFVSASAAAIGSIQRVFVVNWPHTLGMGAAQQAPAGAMAGGPVNQNVIAGIVGAFNKANAGGGGGGGGGGGRKGAGGGGGGGGGRGGGLGGFTALEEAQLAINRQALITARRLRQTELAGRISAALREAPTRGLQTATGEILAINVGGLRGVIERRRRATEASTQATAAANLLANAEVKLDKISLKLSATQDAKKIQQFTAKLHDQQSAVDLLRKNYESLDDKAQELGKNVISTSDKLKVFASNTTGIVAGTILFGATLGAAQAGLTAITQAIGPLIEKFSGYQNVTAAVTSNLADQTRQAGGAVKSTVALAEAQSGLSAQTAAAIQPALEQRAATEAGNKAISDQVGLLVSAMQINRQNQGLGGFDRGLVATTGGFFGTPLGGVPSTAEQVGNLINDKSQGRFGPTTVGAPLNIQAPMTVAGGGTGLTYSVPGGVTPEIAAKNLQIQKEFGQTLDYVNNQLKKGGESVIQFSDKMDLSSRQASIAIIRQVPELKDFADKLEAAGVGLTNIKKPEDVLRALQAENVGAQMPDASLLVKQLTDRIIPAQNAAFDAEANFQLQKLIPGQEFLQAAAQPPQPFGTSFLPPGGAQGIGGFPAVDPQATQSFNEYKQVATAALDAVAAKAREGRAAMADLGVPPELIGELEALGKQAQGIEAGLAGRRAAFEAAQYNHQLFILNRNLADALALTGKRVGAAGRLGALERENFELSKKQNALQIQSQELSLALTQRQINFQKALAGFQAPGETGEERAARIAEAKVEADYAQKQLDIQKQLLGLGKKQFTVGVQIFDESAKRQVQDLQYAISELSQAHKLTLDGAAANETLTAIRAREAQISSEISVSIDKATKKASLAINSALDIAVKSGEAFNKILLQTASAWNIFVTQGYQAVVSLINGPKGGGGGGGGAGTKKLLASGASGFTSGATSIVAGEAGTEYVTVLKNPQRISGLGGIGIGGSPQAMVVIDVHDNNIEAGTQDALVAKIARAVEASMNRRTALLGLRTS